jgi:hypothetical protein
MKFKRFRSDHESFKIPSAWTWVVQSHGKEHYGRVRWMRRKNKLLAPRVEALRERDKVSLQKIFWSVSLNVDRRARVVMPALDHQLYPPPLYNASGNNMTVLNGESVWRAVLENSRCDCFLCSSIPQCRLAIVLALTTQCIVFLV